MKPFILARSEKANFISMLFPVLFILSILCAVNTYAQTKIKPTPINERNIPKGIKYEGAMRDAMYWRDNFGEHIVITSETGPYSIDSEGISRSAELFAYHFALNSGIAKQTWKVYDFIKSCSVDMEVKFVKNAIVQNTQQISDLNNDGIMEVWLIYTLQCAGDVSPSKMKIIMYSGNKKFAMRGFSKLFDVLGFGTELGGDFEFDNEFLAGPKVFVEYADFLWKKNMIDYSNLTIGSRVFGGIVIKLSHDSIGRTNEILLSSHFPICFGGFNQCADSCRKYQARKYCERQKPVVIYSGEQWLVQQAYSNSINVKEFHENSKWRLPTPEELELVFSQRNFLESYESNWYWTNNTSGNTAEHIGIINGDHRFVPKEDGKFVFAVKNININYNFND